MLSKALATFEVPTWAIKPLLYLAGLAAIVWALHAGYSSIYQRGYDAKALEVNMQQMADERTQAIAALAREAEVRAIEVANDAKMRAIAETYQQEKRDAELEAGRVAAELRDGASKLREHWQGCVATAALSGDAASRSLADALKREREESAGRVVAAARACDKQVSGLQAAIRVMQGQ